MPTALVRQTPSSQGAFAAVVVSCLGVPWALLATFKFGPSFAQMFSDFGQTLPRFTQLELSPWFALTFALTLVLTTVLVARKSSVISLAIAAAGLVAQPILFLSAMYLPIFDVASAIR